MKILSIGFIVLFIFSMSLYSSEIDDLQRTVKMLSKQNFEFTRSLKDIEEYRNGSAQITDSEMLEDITQNLMETANSVKVDRSLVTVAYKLLKRMKTKSDRKSRLRSLSSGNLFESVTRNSVKKRKIPAFFEKVSDKVGDLKEKLYDEFMDFDLSFGLKLFKFDILEGLKISSLYKYKLDSDYRKGVHTRIDEWTLKGDLALGTVLKNTVSKSSPIYINISPRKKIIFARHYKTKKAAFKAIPLTPISLPLSIEKVKKLKTGDFVSIPTRMGFSAGLSLGLTQGIFNAGASGGVLMTGNFRVNVYKVDDSHVRLKVTGMRSRGKNGSISINYGLNFFGHDPSGLVNIDDQAVSILGSNLFTLAVSKIKGKQLTVDYTFDLDSAEACDAYEAILKNALKFKPTEIGLSFFKKHGLHKITFGDLNVAESIFQADRELSPEDRRVNRNFMGSIYSETSSKDLRVGLKLLGMKKNSSNVENKVQKINNNNSSDFYIYPVYTNNSEFSILFGLWKEKNTNIALSFQKSTPDWKAEKFYNMTFIHNSYDKRCRESELKDFISDVRNNIGDKLFNKLGLNAYSDIKFTKSFNSKMKIIMNKNNIQTVIDSVGDEDKIYRAIIPVIKGFRFYYTDPFANVDDDVDYDVAIPKSWSSFKQKAAKLCNKRWGGQHYWDYLVGMAKKIKVWHGKDLFSAEKEIRKLYTSKKFYQKIIPRLLLELINQNGDAGTLFVSLNFGGRSIKKFQKNTGINEFEEILHDINELIYQIRYNSDTTPE